MSDPSFKTSTTLLGRLRAQPTDQTAWSESVTRYGPLCVRYNANCCRSLDLPFMNIGIAKGLSVPRVLIGPTAGMIDFLRKGKPMGETPSCSLYVAVTRAKFSVAFVVDNPARLGLTVWSP